MSCMQCLKGVLMGDDLSQYLKEKNVMFLKITENVGFSLLVY